MMMEKLAGLEKKLEIARRYCETEEEAHRNNVDFSSNTGFQYYSKQLEMIPERREKSIEAVQRKKDTFTGQKESAISRIRAEIDTLARRMEQKENEVRILEAQIQGNNNIVDKEIRDLQDKYDAQSKEYIGKTNDIKDSLSCPNGKVYLKNKELIKILENEITEKREGMMEILDQERIRKRASALAEIKREKEEADRKEREERLEALRIMSQERIALQEKKEARWKLLREEREEEVLEELEKTQNLNLGK